ncbi:MAG: NAD(P)/FAD-dependent oxidoreductase [Bacteroidota bacterium]
MTTTKTLIIGAGPAGLAVAGRLRKLGEEFEVIEATDKIAYSWHNHYQRLCLHTVKQLSHLPHLPFPEDYPLYVPREDLVRYYESYAAEFDIKPHFEEMVAQVDKTENGFHIKTSKGNEFQAQHIVVASGVNRVPNRPSFKGEDAFKGEMSHSRSYKNTEPFAGKKVLVVGMGNTGAEVALDLAEHDIEVYLSIRSPITIVPRDVNGRPVQTTAKTLAKIPFGIGDWLGTQIRKRIIGDLRPYGVPLSTKHPAVQLRETGKTPVIDLGTVDYIKNGKIKVVPDLETFTETGATFVDGRDIELDSVILCTGYRAKIQDFIPWIEGNLDKYGVPKGPIGEGEYKGLYFCGFDNYKLGGILGTIFNDSETIASSINA